MKSITIASYPLDCTLGFRCDKNEYRLVHNLMTKYDRSVRPSRNASEPLNITFGLALTQIIDVVSFHLIELNFRDIKRHDQYKINMTKILCNENQKKIITTYFWGLFF